VNRVLFAALVLPMTLSACAPIDGDDTTTITVSAAASLTDAFTDIGEAFEMQNADINVRFNFAGSSTLAEQINAGAPVDIFAAASPASMQTTIVAGTVRIPLVFATNELAIAVPPGNPAGINDVIDLQAPDVTLIICNEVVPCGAAAVALFELNDLSVRPSSLEPDVRAVLTKVIADEADAGIVYRTDVAAAGGQVEGIAIPDDINVVNEYAIALTADAQEGSQAFVDFVLSDQGQQILRTWGFTPP
jgi:molybdate transport system substrate-binding protein